MKNKLFITLALLAGVSYVTAQYNNDDPTKDDQWGLDLGPGDNPYVDEWGPDIHPGNTPIQTKKSVASDVEDIMTDDVNDDSGVAVPGVDNPNVDDPGIDDEWGWDK